MYVNYVGISNLNFYLCRYNRHSDFTFFVNSNIWVSGGSALLLIIVSIVSAGFHFLLYYLLEFLPILKNYILVTELTKSIYSNKLRSRMMLY